jgi:hypothetical protein
LGSPQSALEESMRRSDRSQGNTDAIVEVLKDLLITQLGLAGVPQQNIRKIVGCSINRVNAIVKHLKSAKRGD